MSTAFQVEPRNGDVPFQPAALDIWESKYQLKTKDGVGVDRSMDHSFQRVARALADIESPGQREHWYGRFLWALRHGAIPAGRIMSNAGALAYKPATSTINCTVSGVIHDSMDDILNKVHEAGLTLKAGCGIGYEFSTLRPKGAYVSGAGANTSGPLSFMDVYDKMCFTVSSAGGRRGAQMATFDVGHPDVLDFIRVKRENGRLRQFNLSLLITDEFIAAVKANADWQLAFPLRAKELESDPADLTDTTRYIWREWPVTEGYVTRGDGLVCCKVYKTMPAKRIWDVVMSSTYDFAEPGFIMIDRVNQMNNNWWCEKIRSTNPCVTSDTWVQTAHGPRQVADLIGTPFLARVDGKDHATTAAGFFKTADKDVVRLATREGYQLRLTADHRVRRVTRETRFAIESEWCEAGRLAAGDRVVLNDHRAAPAWSGAHGFSEGYLMGLLIGDGTFANGRATLSLWCPAATANGVPAGVAGVEAAAVQMVRELPHRADFGGWSEVKGRGEFRMTTAALTQLAASLDIRQGHQTITPAAERTSSEFHRGLLRGLFDTDGSVQGTQAKGVSVRLAQSDLGLLEGAQRMLLRLGIASTIYADRRVAGVRSLPDGRGGERETPVSAQHELVIAGENLQSYATLVGFADTEKLARLTNALKAYRRQPNRERYVATVESVTADGFEAVYDVQVPGINAFDANGLHAHNCGEQALPPYGSCLLGSVNLTQFVRDPFTENARFDWDEYREVVKVFTRMLDNVVEINGLPLPQQVEEITAKRRHGMGYLGLGSAMTLLGLRYGSKESVWFTDDVSREMAIAGWQTGLELAKEKGPAPILLREFEVTADMLRLRPEMVRDGYTIGMKVPGRILHAKYSRYMQKVATVASALVAELAEVGSRFTHHTSIAPTGTISLSLANNASNGIEPSFAHHYFRNVIREGRKTKERVDVFSYELLAYRTFVNPQAMPGSTTEGSQLPPEFITADDISPMEHVDIQAAAQQWVDSSISKTANVPTNFPFDAFKNIYLYAHEQGLKGCTTFRFNPEVFQGVLVKEEDLKNTTYLFTQEDGTEVSLRGDEEVEYDGERHTAANLFDALKEGYYGRY